MPKHNFSELAKTHQSVRLKLRYLALAHFQEGHSRTDIAKFLKVSRTSVNKWISQYHKNGLEGLVDKKTTGRPVRLSEAQCKQLIDYVKNAAKSSAGGRLVGTEIQSYITDSFGVHYHLSSVYKLLHRLGFSWITSRSKHPKQSIEAQEDFKKNSK
jgi:transposase